MQSVYKTEEHLSRVKQSKELGIDLNEKTIAALSDDEYSKIVNLV
jgi:transposase